MIWPVCCPECNKKDIQICDECKKIDYIKQINQEKYLRRLKPYLVYIYSYYKRPFSSIILSWKNHGRHDFDLFFQNCMRRLVFDFIEDKKEKLKSTKKIIIIPAPSSKKSIERRGGLQTLILAKGIKSGIKNSCVDEVKIKNILRQKNKTKKQASLDKKSRLSAKKNNIYISLFSRNFLNKNRNYIYLLVDDVITTGSTIKECVNKMNERGIQNIYIFALAFTPRLKE